MMRAHTHTARRRNRVAPGQLGLFDEPGQPVTGNRGGRTAAGTPQICGIPTRGRAMARRGGGNGGIAETISATPARHTRAKPPARACIPVACVGCGRPHAGDTTRTCLCPACLAFRARRDERRLLREFEEAAVAWSEARRAGNAGVFADGDLEGAISAITGGAANVGAASEPDVGYLGDTAANEADRRNGPRGPDPRATAGSQVPADATARTGAREPRAGYHGPGILLGSLSAT